MFSDYSLCMYVGVCVICFYIYIFHDKVLENQGPVSWVERYGTSRAPGKWRKTLRRKLEACSGLCSHLGFAKKNAFSFCASLKKHKWAETLVLVVYSPCLSAVNMNRLTSKHWVFLSYLTVEVAF